jgi:hypothetical protein
MLNERAKTIKDLKDVEITEEMRDKIEERIKRIEAEIEKEFSEERIKDVLETLRELGDEENSIDGERRKKMWKVLKKNHKCCSCGEKGRKRKY